MNNLNSTDLEILSCIHDKLDEIDSELFNLEDNNKINGGIRDFIICAMEKIKRIIHDNDDNDDN